jgi:integrase
MAKVTSKEKFVRLITYLQAQGYSKGYLRVMRTEMRVVVRMQENGEWTSYREHYQHYADTITSSAYLRTKRSIVGLLEQFDIRGIYPSGPSVFSSFMRDSHYAHLSDEFKCVIDAYRRVETERGVKAPTIYVSSLNTATFLYSMQSRGIESLSQIGEKEVVEFFFSDGVQHYGYSFKKNIRAVFKATKTIFGSSEAILNYLPGIREQRKNIQYLTQEETNQLKSVLDDSNSGLCLREKAIVKLLMYTGLRGCDIAALRLKDIDWEMDVIHVTQQKTDVPLTLPLRAVVGNALYDYIVNERPHCNTQEVFVSKFPGHKRLSTKSIGGVINTVYDAAGIRMSKGDRRGSHIFRHLLAVTLLEKEVPQPVISSTLGHTSPDSVEAYLSADFTHLQRCSLSIENFPVRKEVFNG